MFDGLLMRYVYNISPNEVLIFIMNEDSCSTLVHHAVICINKERVSQK